MDIVYTLVIMFSFALDGDLSSFQVMTITGYDSEAACELARDNATEVLNNGPEVTNYVATCSVATEA